MRPMKWDVVRIAVHVKHVAVVRHLLERRLWCEREDGLDVRAEVRLALDRVLGWPHIHVPLVEVRESEIGVDLVLAPEEVALRHSDLARLASVVRGREVDGAEAVRVAPLGGLRDGDTVGGASPH